MTWTATNVWANKEPISMDILRVKNEEREIFLEAISRLNRGRCIIEPIPIKDIKIETNIKESVNDIRKD